MCLRTLRTENCVNHHTENANCQVKFVSMISQTYYLTPFKVQELYVNNVNDFSIFQLTALTIVSLA